MLHVVARKLTNDTKDDGNTDISDAIEGSTDPWIPIMKMMLETGFDPNAGTHLYSKMNLTILSLLCNY